MFFNYTLLHSNFLSRLSTQQSLYILPNMDGRKIDEDTWRNVKDEERKDESEEKKNIKNSGVFSSQTLQEKRWPLTSDLWWSM